MPPTAARRTKHQTRRDQKQLNFVKSRSHASGIHEPGKRKEGQRVVFVCLFGFKQIGTKVGGCCGSVFLRRKESLGVIRVRRS